MKKLLMFVAVLSLLGCNKKSEHMLDKEQNGVEQNGFVFPRGTRFIEHKDAQGKVDYIDFYLPDGYTFYGIVNEQIVQRPPGDGGGRITCTCSGSGGCSPVKIGNRVGCEVTGCPVCTATTSIRNSDGTWQKLDFFFIQYRPYAPTQEERELDELGELLLGVMQILDPQEWIDLPFLSEEDMRDPHVQEALSVLTDDWGSDEGLEQNTPIVGTLWKINDKKAMILVPEAVLYQDRQEGLMVVARPPITSCSGKCKNGTCTKSGGRVVTCTGCDSGCTLHY